MGKSKNGLKKWLKTILPNNKKGETVLPFFFFITEKNKKFFKEKQRKTKEIKEKQRVSNNLPISPLENEENSKKNVDICTKMFYIVSYTECNIYSGIMGDFSPVIRARIRFYAGKGV